MADAPVEGGNAAVEPRAEAQVEPPPAPLDATDVAMVDGEGVGAGAGAGVPPPADHVVVQQLLDALLAHQAAGGNIEVRPVEGAVGVATVLAPGPGHVIPPTPVLAPAPSNVAAGVGSPISVGGKTGKLPPPAKWGDKAEKRKAKTFLADVKEWLERARLDPVRDFVHVLEGKTREDWEVIRQSYLSGSMPMSWDQLVKEFLTLTGADMLDEAKLARERLFGGQVKMTGSLHSYVVDMRAVRNELESELGEAAWVHWFVQGLTPALRTACSVNPVTSKPWGTMAEAVTYALGQYDRLRGTGAAIPSVQPKSAAVRRTSQAVLSQVHETLSVAAAQPAVQPAGPGMAGYSHSIWRKFCQDAHACYLCGGKDHGKEQCSLRETATEVAFLRHENERLQLGSKRPREAGPPAQGGRGQGAAPAGPSGASGAGASGAGASGGRFGRGQWASNGGRGGGRAGRGGRGRARG
jgi:hypothetical protein